MFALAPDDLYRRRSPWCKQFEQGQSCREPSPSNSNQLFAHADFLVSLRQQKRRKRRQLRRPRCNRRFRDPDFRLEPCQRDDSLFEHPQWRRLLASGQNPPPTPPLQGGEQVMAYVCVLRFPLPPPPQAVEWGGSGWGCGGSVCDGGERVRVAPPHPGPPHSLFAALTGGEGEFQRGAGARPLPAGGPCPKPPCRVAGRARGGSCAAPESRAGRRRGPICAVRRGRRNRYGTPRLRLRGGWV